MKKDLEEDLLPRKVRGQHQPGPERPLIVWMPGTGRLGLARSPGALTTYEDASHAPEGLVAQNQTGRESQAGALTRVAVQVHHKPLCSCGGPTQATMPAPQPVRSWSAPTQPRRRCEGPSPAPEPQKRVLVLSEAGAWLTCSPPGLWPGSRHPSGWSSPAADEPAVCWGRSPAAPAESGSKKPMKRRQREMASEARPVRTQPSPQRQ